jgi:hypothetical protein
MNLFKDHLTFLQFYFHYFVSIHKTNLIYYLFQYDQIRHSKYSLHFNHSKYHYFHLHQFFHFSTYYHFLIFHFNSIIILITNSIIYLNYIHLNLVNSLIKMASISSLQQLLLFYKYSLFYLLSFTLIHLPISTF